MKNGNFLFAALILSFLFSCEQEEVVNVNNNDLLVSEAEMDEAYEEIDQVAYEVLDMTTQEFDLGAENARIDRPITRCASREVDTLEDESIQIVFTFNPDCPNARKRKRQGQVIVTFKGKRFEPGSFLTVELVDYYVNGIHFEGKHKIENISTSLDDHPKHKVTLTGGKITWLDNTFALREASKIRTWIRASNPINDETHLDGEMWGTNRRGVDYHTTIIETLVFKRSCAIESGIFMPVAGIKKIDREGKGAVTINYGDGSCDRIYTSEVTTE